jgi:hypothetical protein
MCRDVCGTQNYLRMRGKNLCVRTWRRRKDSNGLHETFLHVLCIQDGLD